MAGLEMKYFVLKPESKSRCDVYASASRLAMIAYADEIEDENPELAKEIRTWADKEQEAADNNHIF